MKYNYLIGRKADDAISILKEEGLDFKIEEIYPPYENKKNILLDNKHEFYVVNIKTKDVTTVFIAPYTAI